MSGDATAALSPVEAAVLGVVVQQHRDRRLLLLLPHGRGLPPYPNWQRKRIQIPHSVSSSLTGGTTHFIRRVNRPLDCSGAGSSAGRPSPATGVPSGR